MATEITMPKLSDTMTEGQLGVWRKNVGDRIERGDIIAEVETDKATMDLEAFTAGILLEQRVKPGDLVPVGTVIGMIGAADETAAQLSVATAPPPRKAPLPTAPATELSPAVTTTAPAPSQPLPLRSETLGVQAAPIVRRRAAELGIDLATIVGSGPEGRVMLDDLAGLEPVTTKSSPGEAASPCLQPAAQPLNRMRSAIARTTSSSWQTIPHFYLSRVLEMGSAEQAIHRLTAAGESVSLNALIMAAAARALLRFPALNSGFAKEGIISYQQVNLAFAVALADGLQVPVIKGADSKTVQELTFEAARLAEKARQGTLSPDDISGGSFTVSNLGMYDIDTMISIIMPGQAGILALGAVADRAVVHNGQLVVARTMTAHLSCDHRIIDGATAAKFLNEFRRLLENPAELPV